MAGFLPPVLLSYPVQQALDYSVLYFYSFDLCRCQSISRESVKKKHLRLPVRIGILQFNNF